MCMSVANHKYLPSLYISNKHCLAIASVTCVMHAVNYIDIMLLLQTLKDSEFPKGIQCVIYCMIWCGSR